MNDLDLGVAYRVTPLSDKSILAEAPHCRVFIHQNYAPRYADEHRLYVLGGLLAALGDELEAGECYVPGRFLDGDKEYVGAEMTFAPLREFADQRWVKDDIIFAHAGVYLETDLVITRLVFIAR